ncbi:PIN domain-containing protein [Streptomyces sp. NPDC055060]
MTVNFLADSSALTLLLPDLDDRHGMNQTIDAGLVGICDVTELEFLYTARSAADRAIILRSLNLAYAWVPVPDSVYSRAREVQHALTNRGEHRAPGVVDLLIAATAELTERTLLHRDHDFEAIARCTGQPTLFLGPPPSSDPGP